jgi:hypothetical protein
MESEKFSVLISPEVLSSDLINLIYTASTTYELGQDECITSATTAIQNTQSIFVYSGMSYILSGGTNGDSLLTGLTMPILFTQTYNDIGFYSEFDGLMVQKDIVTNFLYSGNSTSNLNSVTLYNTSGDYTVSYLDFTTFYVDWGDNSPTQQLTYSPYFNDLNTGRRGFIFNSNPQGNDPTFTPGLPNKFLVGAPYHFYFGLGKGKSAINRYITKYILNQDV